MRTLAFSVILAAAASLLLGGCATRPAVPTLSPADVVQMSKQGKPSYEIVAELKRTNTVLELRASDYVALHEAGVAKEVLDYLQLVQIQDIRWRERSYWYGPGFGPYYGWGPCRYPGRWGC
jgi:hypothetical protein